VLNNQPQGGFVTRQPTANVAVASQNDWGDNGFGFFFQRNPDSQPSNVLHRNSDAQPGKPGNTRRLGGGQNYPQVQQGW